MPEAVAAPAPGGAEKPGSLDELMLAMDVVDTIRHGDLLVERELASEERRAELIERLRRIYRSQGIEVPDRILREGVQALEESRFAYEPPKPGLKRSLALLWVRRHRIARWIAAVLAAIVVGAGIYRFGVVLPQERAVERERIALAETLPKDLATARRAVLDEAKVEAARGKAEELFRDGQRALERQDAAAARRAISDLNALAERLRASYELRIVSRPGEQSGVFRIPDRNPRARNYYLIVEAAAPDGKPVALPITSEEDGKTETVSKFGVRVSERMFEAVRRDKQDDGIVQRARLGEKRRGELDITWLMPVSGGFITRW